MPVMPVAPVPVSMPIVGSAPSAPAAASAEDAGSAETKPKEDTKRSRSRSRSQARSRSRSPARPRRRRSRVSRNAIVFYAVCIPTAAYVKSLVIFGTHYTARRLLAVHCPVVSVPRSWIPGRRRLRQRSARRRPRRRRAGLQATFANTAAPAPAV